GPESVTADSGLFLLALETPDLLIDMSNRIVMHHGEQVQPIRYSWQFPGRPPPNDLFGGIYSRLT
ncbi:hypothetical protein, partial [Pseudomonas proteolytica]|uniref:hypothetical protein n=1 Tax=Pseudomonas proteolytica TaxID=219574 RepID=UPI001CA43119